MFHCALKHYRGEPIGASVHCSRFSFSWLDKFLLCLSSRHPFRVIAVLILESKGSRAPAENLLIVTWKRVSEKNVFAFTNLVIWRFRLFKIFQLLGLQQAHRILTTFQYSQIS